MAGERLYEINSKVETGASIVCLRSFSALQPVCIAESAFEALNMFVFYGVRYFYPLSK